MVYKYYIKRGNRKFGPYYYRSYRVGDKTKKEYLGKTNGRRIIIPSPVRSLLNFFKRIKSKSAEP